ncbi:unnamed protein product [Arctogadus glacialis]
MDCYEGIRKAREECNNTDVNSSKSEDEASGVEHSNEDVKDGNKQICEGSSGKKKRGKRSVKSKEVRRKLSQLQLEELTRREKEKEKQAVVSEPVETILQAVQQGAPQTQPPQQAFSPPVQQPQSQWSPTLPFSYTIQIHLHNTGNPTNGNRQNQNKGPQGQYTNNLGQFRNNQQHRSQGQRRGPLICFGCNQEGHIKKDCLINPFPSQHGQGNSYQGRQDQGSYRGARDTRGAQRIQRGEGQLVAMTKQADEEPKLQVLIMTEARQRWPTLEPLTLA